MSAACLYDNGRDDFLATATSKPPSKFDSIEWLPYDVHQSTTLAFNAARWSPKTRPNSDGQRNGRNTSSSSSSSSSHATAVAGWSGDNKSCCTNSEFADTGSWRAEVSGRLSTAPSSRSAVGVTSPCKTPSGATKKFFWGPKAVCPRQEVDRHIRRTNMGEPATFAMWVRVKLYILLIHACSLWCGYSLELPVKGWSAEPPRKPIKWHSCSSSMTRTGRRSMIT